MNIGGKNLDRCFVIQPFDRGKFDKRFDDVFEPAITNAGLEPYRVDRDPGVTIPIEEIQSGIEASRVCLADITTDNPNVWFELGYAIASQRDVVLVCSDERNSNFPFDVQHRSIIKYSTESSQDFKELEKGITTRIIALLEKEQSLDHLAHMSPVVLVKGLEQFEIAALISAAQRHPDPIGGTASFHICQDMEKAGFTKIATTLAIRGLIAKKMLEAIEEQDYDGNMFTAYHVTESGVTWLHKNTDKLKLKYGQIEPTKPEEIDDDIPF